MAGKGYGGLFTKDLMQHVVCLFTDPYRLQ